MDLVSKRISMKYALLFVCTVLFLLDTRSAKTQVLLQLEINKEIEAVKFGMGDEIVIKTNSSNGEWQKRKLERFIIDQNIIIFEDGMVELKDITHLRLTNSAASAAGKLLSGFGAGWMLFGGIAHFTTENKFTWGQFAIGAVAMGVGWLFNKIAAKKTFIMGKNANLRIIDISFPDVPQSNLKPTIP